MLVAGKDALLVVTTLNFWMILANVYLEIEQKQLLFIKVVEERQEEGAS